MDRKGPFSVTERPNKRKEYLKSKSLNMNTKCFRKHVKKDGLIFKARSCMALSCDNYYLTTSVDALF